MALRVRYDLTIVRSMEAANVRRRFRFGKVLTERAHVRPLMKLDAVVLESFQCLSSVLCVCRTNPDDLH
jgi:hypothetical protein